MRRMTILLVAAATSFAVGLEPIGATESVHRPNGPCPARAEQGSFDPYHSCENEKPKKKPENKKPENKKKSKAHEAAAG